MRRLRQREPGLRGRAVQSGAGAAHRILLRMPAVSLRAIPPYRRIRLLHHAQTAKADAEKAQRLGIEAYNREQTEKLGMLTKLLAEYNGGRKKALFCTAVNLLPLDDLREILQTLAESTALAALPEKSAHAAALLRQAAAARDIELRLRRKK